MGFGCLSGGSITQAHCVKVKSCLVDNNTEDKEGKTRVMSRTAVGGSGSFGRLSGGCKSGWPPITLGVLQRPPSREHRGWLLFVARENFEGPTNFQRTTKHKRPKGGPEISDVPRLVYVL